MMKVNIRTARTHFGRLVKRVEDHNAKFLVTRHSRPVALILPLTSDALLLLDSEEVEEDFSFEAEVSTFVKNLPEKKRRNNRGKQ
jgi:prevent-host-death family protein